MDREELIKELQEGIISRFMELDEGEKNLIRSSSSTPYAVTMRKIIGEEILGGLKSGEPQDNPTKKRGLGAR